MGREIVKAIASDSVLELVGATEKKVSQKYLLTEVGEMIPFSANLGALLNECHPDVLIDFTDAEAAMISARIAAEANVNLVIGTTGLSKENLNELERLCQSNNIGAIVAPNFCLGAVLSIHLAKIAAKFFDHVEIIETHHEEKSDAPSGTALDTAGAILQARGKAFAYPQVERELLSGVRGGQTDGVTVHSLRLPGFVAKQEVIFGGVGQTFSISHNVISRECYMPGIILAVKEVVRLKGLIYGLDALLKL
jgi:4-hydroxy-tetrahydrodipicolinate reductase